MNKKMIIATIAASVINTGVVAGFFDDLVDDLQNGSLESLVSDVVSDVTDVVSDVASEIGKTQDNSDAESNAISGDVLDGLGDFFKNSNETDDTDDYAEEEVFEDAISKEEPGELNSENNQIVVNYDQLSKKSSFFGPDDPRENYKDSPFTGIVDHTFKNGNRTRALYKNGLKHGHNIGWYKNGNLRYKRNWEAGYEVEGENEEWYENGNKSFEDSKDLALRPEIRWYENGQMTSKSWFDVKDKYTKLRFWREDGTKESERWWTPNFTRTVKLIRWNEDGLKTFDAFGYIVDGFGHINSDDITQEKMSKWIYKYNKYYNSYLLLNNNKGDLESFFTISSLPVGAGADSCHYQNVVSKKYGSEIKNDAVQANHSKDGYVITSDDLLKNCVSVAYKACKDDKNDINTCDKLFYQGVYSSEDSALQTQRQNLLKLERRLILKKAESLKKKYAKTWDENIAGIKRPTIIRTKDSNIPLVLEGKLHDEIIKESKTTYIDIGLDGVKKKVKKNQTIVMDISKMDSSKIVDKDLMFDKLYVVIEDITRRAGQFNIKSKVPRAFYGDKPYTGFTITTHDKVDFGNIFITAAFFDLYNEKKYKGFFIKKVVEYKDGYLHGDSYGFYPNGRPSMHKQYIDGSLYDVKKWDPFGYLTSEIIFKDGKAIETRIYDENFDQATLDGHELYPDAGLPLLTSEIDIFNKQWLKTLNKFYGEKKLSLNLVAPMQDRMWDGLVKKYWPNGKILTEETYRAGVRHGEVTFFEPVEMDPETNKQKVRRVINYKWGREQQSLSLFEFDYQTTMKRVILDYECGGGNFAECVLGGVKNRLQVKAVTTLQDGDEKYIHTATWGNNKKIAMEVGLKRNLKTIETSVNTVPCVTSYIKQNGKFKANKILVKMSLDITNSENTDYIVSKCVEAKEKFYSDQYLVHSESCNHITNLNDDGSSIFDLGYYTDSFVDSDKVAINLSGRGRDRYIANPAEACSSELPTSKPLHHLRIMNKGYKSYGLSFNPFIQDNGSSCDSSKGDLCFGRVSKNPALINNKYLDLSNWEKLSKKKSALIEK